MKKIIKPKVNEKGEPIVKHLEKEEWFWDNSKREFQEWLLPELSRDIAPVYYDESWKPSENEHYYYYKFTFGVIQIEITKYLPGISLMDRFNILTGNCFETQSDAKNNLNTDLVIEILTKQTKYYQNKLKDSPNG